MSQPTDASARYRQIAADLLKQIAAQEYKDGASLPSESELASRYDVSRGTIRQAFAKLRGDGVIASRQGARRVVVASPRVQSFDELYSFSRWARATGDLPASRTVALELRTATTEECKQLDLEEGSRVYHLTRVRLLGGEPVMIERTAYVEKVGAVLPGIALDSESITDRLDELGVVLHSADHTIDALAATAADARLLGVRPRTPLLRERRRTADPAGMPIEWSDDRWRSDAIAFSVRNTRDVSSLLKRGSPQP
ncbi:GntR family transcriptional regulator [Antrihabitans spumae]|uniref:GntR family transcriptional regulator n=1 Tax=Antrihabitans spumae TaxID=3373370 RepID=A0ABW7K1I9_9NOCA